jgi:hypothetical protein
MGRLSAEAAAAMTSLEATEGRVQAYIVVMKRVEEIRAMWAEKARNKQ